jgi:F0F1-type ATP synthase assembly protein I
VEPESSSDRLARQQRNVLLRFGGMGLELAGGIVGFVLIGYLIDWKFNTAPVGLVTGACIGCIGGLYNTIRRAIQMQREMESLSRGSAAGRPAGDAPPTTEDHAENERKDD